MQDRPTAAEVVATVAEFLDVEVLPNVDGTLRYHTLVASNLMKMLERELRLYPAAAAAETAALQELLDAGEVDDLLELNGRLHTMLLDAPSLDPAFLQRTWQVLSDATAAKLAISKPGYDRYDMAVESVLGAGS